MAPATAPVIPGKENDYINNYPAAVNSPKSIIEFDFHCALGLL